MSFKTTSLAMILTCVCTLVDGCGPSSKSGRSDKDDSPTDGGAPADDPDKKTPADEPGPPPADVASLLLVQEQHLTYAGAFRVPVDGVGGADDAGTPLGYAYGGHGLAYNAKQDSLFLVGHPYHQQVGEISIPLPKTSSDVAALGRATVLQPLTDITEGHRAEVGDGGAPVDADGIHIGGLLVTGESLTGTVYGYYDASMAVKASHFKSGADFSTADDFKGMFKVGDLNPGYVGGYMGTVPDAWQAAFGGTALTGQSALPIVSRTSLGPAASVFNPSDLGVTVPATAWPVLGYPADHPTLGDYDHTDAALPEGFNMATTVAGIVFPKGSRSVLFFGRQALGKPCYGTGTPDKELDGTTDADGEAYCYDPTGSDKGNHGYPYVHFVWAYAAEDLLAVRKGEKQMWEPVPYKTWKLPLNGGAGRIVGVAYDDVKSRIFLAEASADGDSGELPLIHVLYVNP